MPVVGRAYDHGVDVFLLEEAPVLGELPSVGGDFLSGFFAPRSVDVGDRHDPRRGMLREQAEQILAAPTRADSADADRFISPAKARLRERRTAGGGQKVAPAGGDTVMATVHRGILHPVEPLAPEDLMKRALELAVENVRSGLGGPFGAVVARGGRIVSEGANRVTTSNDPTAHAEIMAIRAACAALDRFELRGCEIYASCEPCPMCLGAIFWARLARIYFAGTQADAAAAGFDDALFYSEMAATAGGRRIPMVPLLGEQGRRAFDEWERKSDRVPY